MKISRILPAIASAGFLLFGAVELNAQATERAPSNATARCKDGSYSAAKDPRRACVRHRGVAQWVNDSSAQNQIGNSRPAAQPAAATARCKDGTYSKSTHRIATCSFHGGVVAWLRTPGGQ